MTFTETCLELVRNKGVCGNIRCLNCPGDAGYTGGDCYDRQWRSLVRRDQENPRLVESSQHWLDNTYVEVLDSNRIRVHVVCRPLRTVCLSGVDCVFCDGVTFHGRRADELRVDSNRNEITIWGLECTKCKKFTRFENISEYNVSKINVELACPCSKGTMEIIRHDTTIHAI